MPTGLAFPVYVNEQGGLSLVSGDSNDEKIITIALMDGENENAFQQDLALGQFMIFGIPDEDMQAKIVMKIVAIFTKFEEAKRFKLLADTMKWSIDEGKGNLNLEFRYLNLESDEEKTYTYNFGE